MEKIKNIAFITVFILLSSCGLTGCGADNADDISDEQSASLDAVIEEPLQESEAEPAAKPESVIGEVPTEETDDLYGFGPVSYDLSTLPKMENKLYAEWNGNIYFRQYSDEDMEKGGLWANFGDIPDTEKELMCLTPDGKLTQVGTDYGCGTMFIVNGRIYSQRYTKQGEDEDNSYEYKVYSCDLDGSEVREYDSAEVLAVRGNRIICKGNWDKPMLTAIDAQTGQEEILVDTPYAIYLESTEEEIFYYVKEETDEDSIYDTVLYSVDYKGNIQKITTVTVAECAELIDENPEYMNSIQIPNFTILGDDLYFSAGYYAGSANMFQGGAIYCVKKDGSDRKVLAVSFNEIFYLYDDGINRALFCRPSGADLEYGETGAIVLSGDAPHDITLQLYAPYDAPYVHGSTNSVLFYPDTSGICYVLVTEQDCEELAVDAYVDGHFSQDIKDVEYLDGKLFFTVTDLTYSVEESIGWRDGYVRGRTACYCKDMESGEIRLLYEY